MRCEQKTERMRLKRRRKKKETEQDGLERRGGIKSVKNRAEERKKEHRREGEGERKCLTKNRKIRRKDKWKGRSDRRRRGGGEEERKISSKRARGRKGYLALHYCLITV